ncbi:MAG: flagellar hook-associated protein 3, partial [Desulfobacula sp.]|nr:flagellar hook-associated protein 3 [Desulfobacula sp.]
MRVPNISIYVNSTHRLGNLTSDLQQASKVVSTQKQINEISDDPLGLSQVLSLKNSIGNLEQIEQNVVM